MSRRDLIVLAILLNIGVLASLLFFSTSGSKNSSSLIAQASFEAIDPAQMAVEVPGQETKPQSTGIKQASPAAFDEIDQLLEEYMATDPKSESEKDQSKSAKDQVKSASKSVPVILPLKTSDIPQSPPVAKPVEKKPIKESVKEGAKEKFYTVKQGDNPWTIAHKFHISFEKLLELNNLDETKARNLKIGQRLKIRE